MKGIAARALLASAAFTLGVAAARAQAERAPNATLRLYTGDTEIVDALRPSALAIDDPLAVFAFVLGSLPVRVRVYPTENYFYFRFTHHGVSYTGNIRLA